MPKFSADFRSVSLPYCLERLDDGRYVALNRRYMPLGFAGSERVESEQLPICFKFKRALSAAQIAKISVNLDAAPDRIYLYDDRCIPTGSANAWAEYSARLQALAKLTAVF